MSIVLNLKMRKTEEVAFANVSTLQQLYAHSSTAKTKEELYKFFLPVCSSGLKTHDRFWLKMIVDFVPLNENSQPKLTSLTSLAPWINLAIQVSKLTDESTSIELSDADATLIWDRLCQPDFRVDKISVPFAEFLLEFQAAAEKAFPKPAE